MNHFKRFLRRISSEIEDSLSRVSPEEAEEITDAIRGADKIFVCGEGRSGLIMRIFAMRLMQLGLSSFVVGETTTPSISKEDLLLACSGSGETPTTIIYAKKAKEQGARVVGITASDNSTLGKLSDKLLLISAPKKGELVNRKKSVQLSGSLFEQTVFIVLDALVMVLKRELKQKTSDMMRRHANLE